MTESEWLVSSDVTAMLRFVTENPDHQDMTCCRSPRKLRLFACACCRAVWDGVPCGRCQAIGFFAPPHEGSPTCPDCHGTGRTGGLTDHRSRRAVEVAERYADGLAWPGELTEANQDAEGPPDPAARAAFWVSSINGGWITYFLNSMGHGPVLPSAAQTALLREVCGNPFKPLTPPPWIPPDALATAAAVYERRAWDALPILADMLEDSGITDLALLAHLRGPGPHVRGCWAVDLLLGKE